ncbi:DUF4229 domain-containing protein [Gordonia neofelifaecis]|uniref:Integral membrane protein n=1 Tax=Gordonia neofelifaecis NRRL B-59395 TaxID=644548 RepID=F1YIP3_9ACTN|nr:DUF4229 domain-containing protein [Gordonia neofelifaecis]EGD55351.1 integral membrane protein [Gordonia neofelifaecis NRRL B-59395]
MTEERPDADDTDQKPSATMTTLIGAVALYTLARLALVVVIAGVIMLGAKVVGVDVPVLVAAVFGVLIALPLGMVVFKSLRLKVNEQIVQVDAQRSAQRSDLQARLRGED